MYITYITLRKNKKHLTKRHDPKAGPKGKNPNKGDKTPTDPTTKKDETPKLYFFCFQSQTTAKELKPYLAANWKKKPGR